MQTQVKQFDDIELFQMFNVDCGGDQDAAGTADCRVPMWQLKPVAVRTKNGRGRRTAAEARNDITAGQPGSEEKIEMLRQFYAGQDMNDNGSRSPFDE